MAVAVRKAVEAEAVDGGSGGGAEEEGTGVEEGGEKETVRLMAEVSCAAVWYRSLFEQN